MRANRWCWKRKVEGRKVNELERQDRIHLTVVSHMVFRLLCETEKRDLNRDFCCFSSWRRLNKDGAMTTKKRHKQLKTQSSAPQSETTARPRDTHGFSSIASPQSKVLSDVFPRCECVSSGRVMQQCKDLSGSFWMCHYLSLVCWLLVRLQSSLHLLFARLCVQPLQ